MSRGSGYDLKSTHLERVPWSDESGWFNGDMFYDWLNNTPQKQDYDAAYKYEYARKVWVFLNRWESAIRDQTREQVADEVRSKLVGSGDTFRMKIKSKEA